MPHPVYQEVEAVLLNSECPPAVAVLEALRCTARFADLEAEITAEDFVAMARDAWRTACGQS
jgi:hypothetical protein